MTSVKSDETLIAEIAQGDTEAFKILIERYQSQVIGIAYRYVGNSHDAEDIAQEAFIRVYKNAGRYQPTAKFKTWFFRILTNLCLDFRKKKKPVYFDEFYDTPSDTPTPAEELEISERQKMIHQAIQSLPESQRMALILHHYEGLKYKEISQAMGCSVKAVESLLVRAKRTLEKRLAGFL